MILLGGKGMKIHLVWFVSTMLQDWPKTKLQSENLRSSQHIPGICLFLFGYKHMEPTLGENHWSGWIIVPLPGITPKRCFSIISQVVVSNDFYFHPYLGKWFKWIETTTLISLISTYSKSSQLVKCDEFHPDIMMSFEHEGVSELQPVISSNLHDHL